jgi:hypothetical protein
MNKQTRFERIAAVPFAVVLGTVALIHWMML